MPVSTLSPLVRKLQLWSALDGAEQEAVLALPHKVERVDGSKYLVREDDKPTHSCLMLSGFAICHKIVGDGSRSISAVQMKGDVVDLQNSLLGVADHNVQTLTQTEVAFIPRQAIMDLAVRCPKVGLAMWYDTLVDGSMFREWIANISRRDAITRLGHIICEFGLRLEYAGLGSRTSYELPMTQEQLADATGLTAVHVNRSLKELEARGLITRTVRSVGVADWDRLEKAADFSARYLHLREPNNPLQ